MSSAFHRKCPLCGGDLVRSQTHASGYTTYFWKKPWKRGGFFGWGLEKVFPWACMGCGVVLLYLERLPAVAEEFRSLRNGERAPEGQPAPLKS
jgi:hypothetical protein